MAKNVSDKWASMTQLFGITTAVLGLLVLLGFFIFINFDRHIGHPVDMSSTGQVGDFIGGVVGSLWALSGVFLFFSALRWQKRDFASQLSILNFNAKTLNLQAQEIALTKDIMNYQRFEHTLFNLISNHRQLTDSIKYKYEITIIKTVNGQTRQGKGSEVSEGKSAFKQLKEDFLKTYKTQTKSGGGIEQIRKVYEKFHQQIFPTTGHYFRNLYHLIKFINDSHEDELTDAKEEDVSKINRRFSKYAEFVQASLSSDELFMIFYNGLIFPRAHCMLEKYTFLENLPLPNLIDSGHVNFYPKTQFK